MKWLEHPTIFSPLKYEYLEKLFFFRYLPKDKIPDIIQPFIKSVAAELDKLEKIEREYGCEIDYYGISTSKQSLMPALFTAGYF